MIRNPRVLLALAAAMVGATIGALLGGLVLPPLAADGLFTTSAGNIRIVSLPVLSFAGFWAGAVAGDLLAGADTHGLNRGARFGGWSLVLGMAALVLSEQLVWLVPVGLTQALFSRLMGGELPFYPFVWFWVVNSLGAALFAVILGLRGAYRADAANRPLAVLGSALGIAGLCLSLGWLALGGWFGLFWGP